MRRSAAVTAGIGLVGAAAVAGIVYGWQRAAYLEQVDAARSVAEGLRVATDVHVVLPGEEPVAAALVHTFSMPEVHDGQMLTSGCFWYWNCDDYDGGPVYARVHPNVDKDLDQFSAPLTVAYLSVAAKTKFDDFGLDGGNNATVVVVHELRLKARRPADAANPDFEATIKREGKVVKTLFVQFTPKPVNASRDIPPVLGFFWYPRGVLTDHPMIGIKCPGGWCFVGEVKGEPTWSADGTSRSRCTSADQKTDCVDVFGFHDEQQLAVSAGANGKKKRGESWGLVLPVRDLGSKKDGAFDGVNVPVATIRIWGKPYSKKSVRLPTGAQLRLSLSHTGSDIDEGWEAMFEAKEDGSNSWTVLKDHISVDRTRHTELLVGAARWEWDPNDEGVWVRCGAGCCKISFL